MQLKQYGLLCLLITGCYADGEPSYSAHVDAQDQRTLNIHIHQNVTQDMSIINENNSNAGNNQRCKCYDYFGTKLIECMKSIPAEKLKENFIKLTGKSASSVLDAFNTQETTELVTYFTPEEWREWHAKLPADIQKKVSATRENAIRSARRKELYKELVDTIKGLILL